MEVIKKDTKFLQENNLMDYSMLFIKVKMTKKCNDTGLKRMPALVYIRSKDGNNELQLREIDDAPLK